MEDVNCKAVCDHGKEYCAECVKEYGVIYDELTTLRADLARVKGERKEDGNFWSGVFNSIVCEKHKDQPAQRDNCPFCRVEAEKECHAVTSELLDEYVIRAETAEALAASHPAKWSDEDSAYIVDIGGINAHGETPQQAMAEFGVALSLTIDAMTDRAASQAKELDEAVREVAGLREILKGCGVDMYINTDNPQKTRKCGVDFICHSCYLTARTG